MADLMIVAILVVVLGAAVGYVRKAQKSGRKCIGCPGGCASSGSSCGAYGCGEEHE